MSEQPGGLVEVSRTGGFAGMTLRGRIDLDRLPGDQLSAWQSALTEGLVASESRTPAPDRFVYRVRNQRSGIDVSVGDQELSEDLRTLLESALRQPPAPA
jgi:hypothetical protein